MTTKEIFLKEYARPGSPIAFASPALIYYYYPVWRTLLRQSGPDDQTAFTLMTEGSQTRTSRI